ncbi:MAG: NlpC/P60 family protein [Gaiellaceae bacterium]
MNGFPKRQLITLLIAVPALVGVLVLTGSAVANPSISSKRADAQRAWDQINQMDIQLEKVVARYDGAVYHLKQTTASLDRTKVSLGLARKSLDAARHALAQRVISVYMEQGQTNDSTVAILFQATSIQDMIDRVEAAQRISDHDARVVKQVKILRDQTARQAVTLEKLQAKQRAYVGQISAEKSSVESKIAERKAYVHRVRNEIASLVAEQKRQAAAAAAQARRTVASYNTTITAPTAPSGPTLPGYTPAPASSVGEAVVQAAMSRMGAPYVWGAAGPDEFDCSGLVVWSFAQVGMSLPHYSYDLMAGGVPVAYSDLQPGDLVFFYGGSHVGIYIGGGQFIHAPHTGTDVQVNSLAGYGGGMTTARRYG